MTEERATAGGPPAGGRTADGAARPDNAFLALVRIPVFRRLWAAITVSSLGDWLGLLATTAMAQQLTRDESLAVQGAAISGVILTRLLPDLLLGPLAGALADKLDRRTTVVVGELLALALYLSIAVTYELTWLYVAQFLVEAVGLFTNPAKQAMWVSIVPRERLAVANQVSLFSVYGAVPVAALVFALLSTASRLVGEGDGNEAQTAIVVALVFNAGSFGVSAVTVLFSRRLIPGTPVDRDGGQRNVFSLVVEGVSFLRGQPFMRALYVGVIGAFGAGGLTVGVAQLYVATLRAGAAGYSVVFGVVFTGLAIGMLAGPRILPTVPRRSVFTHAIGLAGIALLVMSVLRDFVLATAAAFCVGLFAGVSWIIGYTLIGYEVEDRLRGRVFAFVISSVRVVLLLAVAVGPGLAGLLGTHDVRLGDLVLTLTGPGLTLLVGGVIALLVSAYATRQVVPARSRTRVRDVLKLLWGRSDLFSAASSGVGLFVVVEGADRELTQRYAADLARVLREESGRPVEVTSEPSDTQLGRQVRGLLFPSPPDPGSTRPGPVDDSGSPIGAHTAALLAAADRAQHVATVIRPALEDRRVVVNTHYVDTSIAFHGAGQGLDGDRIFRTSLWATRGLLPDLTVVVDSPVTAAPSGADPEAVRRAFLGLAEAAPDRYVVVPGELLDPATGGGLVSPVVRRRLATLVATRYPGAGSAEAPAGPATPGAGSTAAAERAGRSVG
ncbi:MFS transporter [Geodermatophilus sp. DSM 45219]|uniref:bifunctional MFS transporter/dTMP kinase n=1 Tax=Geodermatophilus sp. DSM 45219 TaxID=1881103 RepID=UPI00088BD1A6|nr:MFS transporter [Geodermatophilus sp. DSM 45219]SDN93402.1 thymidylate kinase [Geodermatophilus sp. DSM 45219]